MNRFNAELHLKYINEVRDESGRLSKITFNIPEDFNFSYDVIDLLAAQTPNRRAMLWCNQNGAERTFTFADISRDTALAASVLSNAGVKKGDKVMLVLKRHYEFWPTALALHKLGAIAVPATNQLAAKDFVYRFKAAGVSAIVCTGEGDVAAHVDTAAAELNISLIRFMVNGSREGWGDYAKALKTAAPYTLPRNNKVTDPILMYFTSGTSGYPKMVTHDHSYPIAHIVTAKYWHKVSPDGLHLTIAETGWAKSVWGKLYGQWFMEAGIFVYDYDRFVSDDLLRKIEKNKVTSFCAPPTMYRFFIKEDLSKYDLSSLEHVPIAGEALNPEVFEQFKKATGLSLFEGYGQTESTLTVFNRFDLTPRPGSMGMPSPAYDVDIIDENGNSTIPGVTGEIILRCSPETRFTGLFKGYSNDDELNAKVYSGGVYHTGDTAWRDEDGYYWYVGRTDDIIKSSGYRIGPFEVENVIMEHPAVLECAVTPAPDPIRGQVVKATIVLAAGYSPSNTLMEDIQNYVKTHTAPYKYPRIIEFVPALPKTISGKIRRNEIKRMDAEKSEK
jgi:acetyl-CoA synthetase